MPAATDVRVRRVAVLLAAGLLASADATGHAEDAGWGIEDAALRFAFVDQHGRGGQSQADVRVDADGVPRGRERMWIYQPAARVVVRQNAHLRHTLEVPIDVVTHASADALDAVSSASRLTTSGDGSLTTTWEAGDDDVLSFRGGYHLEEEWQAGFGGVGYTRELADDNATLGVTTQVVVDTFSAFTPSGRQRGNESRGTVSIDGQFSQVLSRTTIAWAGYGLTHQRGTLERTWNAVPVDDGGAVLAERLPDTRLRHALYGRIAQHVPLTRTTLRGGYRFYVDDFDARAHSVDVSVLQWLGRSVYVRGDYRIHDQTGVSFFVDRAPAAARDDDRPITSDSDLADFTAHELGGSLVVHLGAAPMQSGVHRLSVGYLRYFRPELHVDVGAVGYLYRF